MYKNYIKNKTFVKLFYLFVLSRLVKFLPIGNRDPIQAADEPNYNRNSRLNNWIDINEDDIKLFMAHIIVMGVIRKPNDTKYWSWNPNINTPFFGKYMGRINFECILSNIHLSDNTLVSTDPLVKLKPFIDTCDRIFYMSIKVTRISVLVRQVVSGKAGLATKCTTPESH